MNPPTSMTRVLGKPRVAGVLYVGCVAAVLGWYGGEVPWWLALMALCFVGNVRKAVQDVRRYNQWSAAWDGMSSAPRAAPTSRPMVRRRKAHSPWAGVIVAALSLVVIPVCIASPAADETLRKALTLLWLGMAAYLVCKLALNLRAARVRKGAGTVSAGGRKDSAPADVVEWVLPRASSSPSYADALRRVPDYCARLMASQ